MRHQVGTSGPSYLARESLSSRFPYPRCQYHPNYLPLQSHSHIRTENHFRDHLIRSEAVPAHPMLFLHMVSGFILLAETSTNLPLSTFQLLWTHLVLHLARTAMFVRICEAQERRQTLSIWHGLMIATSACASQWSWGLSTHKDQHTVAPSVFPFV